MYSLFLDDERFPPSKNQVGEWVIARNIEEVKKLVQDRGFPAFISFDHDLGEENNQPLPTGYDVAKWLVDYDMDNNSMPVDFSFYVHSQNPIGARNIQSYLDSYLKIKNV